MFCILLRRDESEACFARESYRPWSWPRKLEFWRCQGHRWHSCCLDGPLSSILRISSRKVDCPDARGWPGTGMPIASHAYSAIVSFFVFGRGALADLTLESTLLNSSPNSKVRWSILKARSFSFVFESAAGDGMIETAIVDFSARRKKICVAKRVQSPLSRGKGRSVRPFKTEDLPLDWSSTTTSFIRPSSAGHSWTHWRSYLTGVKECIH